MLRGLLLSLILHSLLAIMTFFVLPNLLTSSGEIEVAVEILSPEEFAEIALPPKKELQKKIKLQPKDNKIRQEPPEPKQERIKLPEPELDPKPETKQEEQKQASLDAEAEAVIEQEEVSEEAEGPDEVAEEFDQDLEDILGEIKKIQRAEEERIYREKKIYGDGLNPFEKKAIRKQVNSCWRNITNKLFNKDDIKGIRVKVLVSLDKNGKVIAARLADMPQQYMGLDNFLYRQVADSALSTFYRCNKLHDLPSDKYEAWKEFEFIFDPNDL